MQPLLFIGVPFWLGEPPRYESAVKVIKHSGYADEHHAKWIELRPDYCAHPDPIDAVNYALATALRRHSDYFPIIFAGDCMASLGAVSGLNGRDMGVVWYDAHGDFNTPETTPSGFIGGMPLAMLTGRGNLKHLQALKRKPLREKDIILTDARNLDPEELEAVKASKVNWVNDVTAMETVALPDKPLYLHVDTDIVDADEMPGSAYPESNGPSLDNVAKSLRRIMRDGDVVGITVTVWDNSRVDNPEVPLHNTLKLVNAIIKERSAIHV